MAENDLIKEFFKEEYGVSVQPVVDVHPMGNYTRIKDTSVSRVFSILRDLPFIEAQYNAEQRAAGTYRVIFDKGLGSLQKSAANPERLRANVVAYGSNNKIVGQAELEKFQSKVISPSLAVFEVASIVTGQYYLSRIDRELTSIHKELKNIVRILENSKESELLAHERALQSVYNKLSIILQDDDYRKSTFNNVQHIRMSAMSFVEYYYRERVNILESYSKAKAKKASYVSEFLDTYRNKLELYSRSFHVYSLAYVLEVILSQMTGTNSIKSIKDDIMSVAHEYNQEYEGHFANFNNKTTEDNNITVKDAGANFIGGAATGVATALIGISALPVAGLVFGGVWLGNTIKGKKAEAVEQFKESLIKIEEYNAYNNNIAEKAALALDALDHLYNNRVELLVRGDEMYVKV